MYGMDTVRSQRWYDSCLETVAFALNREVHLHVRAIRGAQEQVQFPFCPGSAHTYVQVLTYLGRVVMEMLHT